MKLLRYTCASRPGEATYTSCAGFDVRARRLSEHERSAQASDLMERFAGAVGLQESDADGGESDDESDELSSNSSVAVAPDESSLV